ncbi:MAG: hypothetical protein ACI4TK_06605 [Agathobacter sp.]
MMMFNRNVSDKTAEEYRASAEAHKNALKSQWKIFLRTGLFLVVTLVVIVVLTSAWFANNKEVSAQNSSITTETPTPSLFIALGKNATTDYFDSVEGSADNESKGLYPISTVDCKKWYYAKEWESEVVPEVDGGDGIATRPVVSGYGEVADQDETDMAVTYTDSFGKSHTAYYKQSFNVYTDRGSLDVYLNPENPITVSYGDSVTSEEGKAEADKIRKALRIAIVVDLPDPAVDDIFIYYVPVAVAENEKGNSKNATAGKYQGINGTTADAITEITTCYVPETISGITAAKSAENDNEYTTKTGSLKLGTADSRGVVLDMYVWLEGTDAQALKTITAGIEFPVAVTVSLVGVESAT